MDIQGKLAIVTGVSSGIGHATALALLEEGVSVAGWSRSAPSVSHSEFKHYAVDVGKHEGVDEKAEQTVNDFGKHVSILVNCAGVGHCGAIDQVTPDEWYALFNTNVHGIYHVTRNVVPAMKEQEEGVIINISSGAGTNGIPEMAAYCGTKHAVHGITHALHQELRNYGIKVTCLAPGSVKTAFSEHMGAGPVKKNALDPKDIADAIVHTAKMPKNFHYQDMEVRPLQPNKG